MTLIALLAQNQSVLAAGECKSFDPANSGLSCAPVPYAKGITGGTGPAAPVFNTTINATLQNWGAADVVPKADASVTTSVVGSSAPDHKDDAGIENRVPRAVLTNAASSTGVSLFSLASSIRAAFDGLLDKFKGDHVRSPESAVTVNVTNVPAATERAGGALSHGPEMSASGVPASPLADAEVDASDIAVEGPIDLSPPLDSVSPKVSGASAIDVGPGESITGHQSPLLSVNSNAIDFDVLGSGTGREPQHAKSSRKRPAARSTASSRPTKTSAAVE